MIKLRRERLDEHREVENLTREAFWNVYRPGCGEHLVLHNLRRSPNFVPELDCVAEADGRIVGHIAYAKLSRNGEVHGDVIGFGPVSVRPEMQGRGVGTLLVAETMAQAAALGYKAVLITGNPDYYGRFGFVSASRYGARLAGIPIGDEAPFFMARELEAGYLARHAGVYAFDGAYEIDAAELTAFDAHFPVRRKRDPRPGDL